MFNGEQSRHVALCYIRTRGQENVLNPNRERQRANILKKCRKLDLTPEFYEDHDPALSGIDLKSPGWNHLAKRIGDPDVGALVVDEQSRITRSFPRLIEVCTELEEHDVPLYCADGNQASDLDLGQ